MYLERSFYLALATTFRYERLFNAVQQDWVHLQLNRQQLAVAMDVSQERVDALCDNQWAVDIETNLLKTYGEKKDAWFFELDSEHLLIILFRVPYLDAVIISDIECFTMALE